MHPMDSQNNEIVLLFPPFLFNTFHGPYLSIPHLNAFLRSNAVTDIHLCDVNIAVFKELSETTHLEQMANEVDRLVKSAPSNAAKHHLLHQKYVLRYVLEDSSCIQRDEMIYRLFGAVILDKLNTLIKKEVSYQIACAHRQVKIPFLFNVVEKTIADLPASTKLIGISIPTADQFYAALQLALTARKRFQDAVHITLGGCLFSLLNQQQLAAILATSYVDSIVQYEGEKPLLGLCRYVKMQEAFERIPNLLFFRNGRLQDTPVEPPVPIDECPPPLFPPGDLKAFRGDFYLPVLVTRGCYWGKCTFCDYVHLTGYKHGVQAKSEHRLLAEIEKQIGTHGGRNFELITDCLSPALGRKFARAFRQHGLDIQWKTCLRIDAHFSEQLCRHMFEAGCRKVSVGVESFSNRQLRLMQKGYSRPLIINVLKRLKRAGIQVTISLIANFAGVTLQEMQESLEALVQHRDLFEALHVFPFILSRLSKVAQSPSQFGISLKNTVECNHTRGFNYIQFTRLSGVCEREERRMLAKYYQVSQGHRRQQRLEKSMQVLENNAPDAIVIRPQERFLFLSGDELDFVVHLLKLAPPQRGETLFFDLESKAVETSPLIIKKVYDLLGHKATKLSALKEAIDMGGKPDINRDAVFKNLLSCGIYLGLFWLQANAIDLDKACSSTTAD